MFPSWQSYYNHTIFYQIWCIRSSLWISLAGFCSRQILIIALKIVLYSNQGLLRGIKKSQYCIVIATLLICGGTSFYETFTWLECNEWGLVLYMYDCIKLQYTQVLPTPAASIHVYVTTVHCWDNNDNNYTMDLNSAKIRDEKWAALQ